MNNTLGACGGRTFSVPILVIARMSMIGPLSLGGLMCRWRVDLGVSTNIAGLVLASQMAMGDLRILVGDSTQALDNAECAVGVQIEANSTFSQV